MAGELDRESKEVLTRAQELGIGVKTASSGLDEDAVAAVKLSYQEGATAATPVVEEAAASQPVAESPASEPAVEDESTPDVDVAAAAEIPVAGDEESAAEPAGDEEDMTLIVEEGITAQEFARMVGSRTGDVVKTLLAMGEMVPGGSIIPTDAIEALGEKFGYSVLVEEAEVEEATGPTRSIVEYDDDLASLESRPPVVTVMGHVDHGKTQLLDRIRSTNVVAGEAGGITQHIGAYQVSRADQTITFIDTPGHEAFSSLRARGAEVTDIAIIVVAADDGVMPQTVEAISHAQAAEVPLIIAINKMDLDSADPNMVRGALTQHNVVVTDLGGDVEAIELSALKGDGVDDLLETISLVAEVEEFKADPKAPAVGTVIEAQLEVGRGPVATVIVQRGTLRRGDALVAGPSSGRVRAMYDDNGNQVKEAGPSSPVLVAGWDSVPTAGDMFQIAGNERTARKLAETRVTELRELNLTVPTATDRLGALLEQLRTADHAELRIVVKVDAHGSLEAIRDAVAKISRDDGKVTIIHSAVGGITENDIVLAETAGAVVYGFNTRPDTAARRASKSYAIDVRTFNIIYELLEDVEGLLLGKLAPEEVESFLGVAEVRAVFRAPRLGAVAGSFVTEGEINRNAKARLVRDGVVIYDGRIASLRRFKDDVQSVAAGFECGIGLDNFRDIKEGDTIESYEVREIVRT